MKALDRCVETLGPWIVTSSVTFIKSGNQSSIKLCLLVRRLHLYPLLWLLEKVVFNTNITVKMQVIVASFNEKRNWRVRLGQKLCWYIRRGGYPRVCRVGNLRVIGEWCSKVGRWRRHSKLNTCWYLYTSLTSAVVVCKDGVPPRFSMERFYYRDSSQWLQRI